jgi:uncharacterized Zn ribbon protein
VPWKVTTTISSKICPECGSANNFSSGPSWNCHDCGRNWSKIYRKREHISTYPPCFHCGSTKVISWGEYYLCKDCHRKHKKEAITQETSLINFIEEKSIVVR